MPRDRVGGSRSRRAGLTTELGTTVDLRHFTDASFDVVLLIGPLYHLQTREGNGEGAALLDREGDTHVEDGPASAELKLGAGDFELRQRESAIRPSLSAFLCAYIGQRRTDSLVYQGLQVAYRVS